MGNHYSATWYSLFMESIPPEQTEKECAFLARQLPNPPFLEILDLACGQGRHANALAALGYQVTGVDLNSEALAEARMNSGGQVRYLELDIRRLADLPGSFDAVLSLWQSFGYFEQSVNEDILRQVYRKLNLLGCLVLDIYQRSFFDKHQGLRTFEKQGQIVTETKRMAGNHLSVRLDYGPGKESDRFEWQLYTPEEICVLGEELGFRPRLVCAGFDEKMPAVGDQPRMQILLEKM